MTINAFHPDYAQTYLMDFLESVRKMSNQSRNGQLMTKYVEEKRKTNPHHGTFFGISKTERISTTPEMMKKAGKK